MRSEMIAFFILFYGNKIHYQIDILPKDVLYKLVPVKIGGCMITLTINKMAKSTIWRI